MSRFALITAAVSFAALALPGIACAETGRASGPSGSSLRTGDWGGSGISLRVGDSGVTIEWGCASGTIDKIPQLDGEGKFSARGSYRREGPGPVREGSEDGEPARYSGRVQGDTLTLQVTLASTGAEIGTFTFTYGKATRVVKCQ